MFTAFLIGGFLGVGLSYLYTGSMIPSVGERVKVCPTHKRNYSGTFGGITDQGVLKVNSNWHDPDSLDLLGPEYLGTDAHPYVDLTRGWVKPSVLAQFKKAHNREGYRKRKGRR